MKDFDLGEGFLRQLDQDEFRFAKPGWRSVSYAMTEASREVVRGMLYTPSGDCIPTFVTLFDARAGQEFSHVGRVDIPADWLDEFASSMRKFYFRSESGEFFTQLQVIEDMAPEAEQPDYRARIVLLRGKSEPPPCESQPIRSPLPAERDKVLS